MTTRISNPSRPARAALLLPAALLFLGVPVLPAGEETPPAPAAAEEASPAEAPAAAAETKEEPASPMPEEEAISEEEFAEATEKAEETPAEPAEKDYLPGLRALVKLGLPELEGATPGRVGVLVNTMTMTGGNYGWIRRLEDGGLHLVGPTGATFRLPSAVTLGEIEYRFQKQDHAVEKYLEQLEQEAERNYVRSSQLVKAALVLRSGRPEKANRLANLIFASDRVERMGKEKFILGAMGHIALARVLTAAGAYARDGDLKAYQAALQALDKSFSGPMRPEDQLRLEAALARTQEMLAAAAAAEDPLAAVEDAGLRALLAALVETRDPGPLVLYSVLPVLVPAGVEQHFQRGPEMRARFRGAAATAEDAEDAEDGEPGTIAALWNDRLTVAAKLLPLWDDRTPLRLIGPPVADGVLREAAQFSFENASNGWLSMPLCRGDVVRLLVLSALPAKLAGSLADSPTAVKEWLAEYRQAAPRERHLMFINGGNQQQVAEHMGALLAEGGEEAVTLVADQIRARDPWRRVNVLQSIVGAAPEEAPAVLEALLADFRERQPDDQEKHYYQQLRRLANELQGDPNLRKLMVLFGVEEDEAFGSRTHYSGTSHRSRQQLENVSL
jgi:hypothetical protein